MSASLAAHRGPPIRIGPHLQTRTILGWMTSDSLRRWRITFVHTLLYRAVLLAPSLLPPRLAVAIACRVGRVKYRSMRPTLDAQSANMQRRLQVSADVTQRVLRRSYELEACEVLEGALARFRPKVMLDL